MIKTLFATYVKTEGPVVMWLIKVFHKGLCLLLLLFIEILISSNKKRKENMKLDMCMCLDLELLNMTE